MFCNRRLSRSTRLTRALTALITVWCLGCSAFDPLLCRLAGLSVAGMRCGADEAVGVAASAGADQAPTVRATPADDGQTDDVLCACQSCTAPAPAVLALAAGPPLPPRISVAAPALLPSLERAPLVPPPQRAL